VAMKPGLGLGWKFAWFAMAAGVRGLRGCGAWSGNGLVISGAAFGVFWQGGGSIDRLIGRMPIVFVMSVSV